MLLLILKNLYQIGITRTMTRRWNYYIPAAIPSIVDNIYISHYHWLQHYEDCIEKLYNIYVYIDLRSEEEENDCSSSKPYRNHTNTKFMIREKKRQIGYSGGRSFCLVSHWSGSSFVAGCCLLDRTPRLSRPTYAPTTPLNPFFFLQFFLSFPFGYPRCYEPSPLTRYRLFAFTRIHRRPKQCANFVFHWLISRFGTFQSFQLTGTFMSRKSTIKDL